MQSTIEKNYFYKKTKGVCLYKHIPSWYLLRILFLVLSLFLNLDYIRRFFFIPKPTLSKHYLYTRKQTTGYRWAIDIACITLPACIYILLISISNILHATINLHLNMII